MFVRSWLQVITFGALRIASHFFDRSNDTKTFKRGYDAHNHPDFFRQIGKDPDQLVAAAINLLQERFLSRETRVRRRGIGNFSSGRRSGN